MTFRLLRKKASDGLKYCPQKPGDRRGLVIYSFNETVLHGGNIYNVEKRRFLCEAAIPGIAAAVFLRKWCSQHLCATYLGVALEAGLGTQPPTLLLPPPNPRSGVGVETRIGPPQLGLDPLNQGWGG